ncbi:hypothetical protein A0H81_13330 [Grifola frondosa]|uniref:Secreted protein n=1 Tax=Grifola frondosa TaxID=5627 RepID=A0A1C7LVG7_GRIFR|nr:hypothetical protein A0H81_13330 [Grifola frondosa]
MTSPCSALRVACIFGAIDALSLVDCRFTAKNVFARSSFHSFHVRLTIKMHRPRVKFNIIGRTFNVSIFHYGLQLSRTAYLWLSAGFFL